MNHKTQDRFTNRRAAQDFFSMRYWQGQLGANIVPAGLFRKLDHLVNVFKCQRRKLYMRRTGIHTLCLPDSVMSLQSIYNDYEELPIRIMYLLH